MKKEKKPAAKLPLWKRPALWWTAGWAVLCAVGVLLVYYWRVFYSFDRMGAAKTTALAVLVLTLVSVLDLMFRPLLQLLPLLPLVGCR